MSADSTGQIKQPQAALLDQALNGLSIHGSVSRGPIHRLHPSVAKMALDW
ncbi:hypothetical protein SynPROSU1_01237 [Synechococcus sp. PROS-U-1]|nr:hypothetical protein SynPROSU1_01237 [Synechococcus sp. PROS-U-1]